MAKLSDVIEDFIKDMLEEGHKSQLDIQRNELAVHFKCSPSQINYVLTTRFTTSKGYYIESKRGGGGCITINKVEMKSSQPILEDLLEKIGEEITYDGAVKIIDELKDSKTIGNTEQNLMKSAVNDRTLISISNKNKIRGDILKAMIIALLL